MKSWHVGNGYEIRQLSSQEFGPLFREHRTRIFERTIGFDVRNAMSEGEKEALKRLAQKIGEPYVVNLGLYHRGEFVGWSWGRQDGCERFHMVNSAVFPEHRRKGFYRALMERVVNEAASEGFQIVYSRHAATNSAILIPKLKFGFIITSFEISDAFGLLVHVSYFTNPIRRKVMQFRVGELMPDDETRKFLGI